ncbi:MAG: tail fiber domain-containing protein [Ignavibacteriales bacterium]|nr:tail fiber domain-containing protein [Ignavibacteriales bacterium]
MELKSTRRIANPGIEEIGVIAQELQKVYPQAVSGSPNSDVNTDPMMVDYSKLTPLLVKGMQEQQEKISSQNVRIKELEERLAKLESLLDGKRFTSVSN